MYKIPSKTQASLERNFEQVRNLQGPSKSQKVELFVWGIYVKFHPSQLWTRVEKLNSRNSEFCAGNYRHLAHSQTPGSEAGYKHLSRMNFYGIGVGCDN